VAPLVSYLRWQYGADLTETRAEVIALLQRLRFIEMPLLTAWLSLWCLPPSRDEMPTQLHKDIRFHQKEIEYLNRAIAKVESGAGTTQHAVLNGLRETLRAHAEALAELEKRLASGT
jgi:hypothetical protein